MTYNILQAQGFQFETGGGGCQLLSRYIDGGGFVWATCIDGGGLPDTSNWLVCAYGDDIDDIIYQASSESDLTLERAIDQALIIADTFLPADATCRNGLPWADCDCC